MKKAAFLPKPYAVGQDIEHLEHVRPLGASINIALDKAAKSEANLALPTGSGPRGNPSVLRRLKLSAKAPAEKITKPKIHPLKVRRG